MSTYTLPIRDWVDPLRNLAPGTSVAALFLVPAASYPVLVIEQQPVNSEIGFVVTSIGGFASSRPLFDATSSGLETPTFQKTAQQTNDTIELERIPHLLREMSGLPVETLASLAHVSRNAYYKWLDGKGVSDEHAKRLTELLDAFRTIRDLCGPALKEFLEAPGPAGRPVDLLAADKSDVVIGLALRPLPDHIDSGSVSKAARDISGLSGWARPAVRLNWRAPHLSASELDRALDRLSPRPLMSHDESPDGADENDDAFVAWGFVWE
jgi:transcriptional regulator with XRE-family HTH domain